MGLLDQTLLGRKFTLFQPNGGGGFLVDWTCFLCSRVDVIFQARYPKMGSCKRCLKSLPYHSLLYESSFGSETFIFDNHWFVHSNLNVTVQFNLATFISLGWKAFVLKEKLKSLKGALQSVEQQIFWSARSLVRYL